MARGSESRSSQALLQFPSRLSYASLSPYNRNQRLTFPSLVNARIELERRLIQSTSNHNEAHSLADLTHIGGSKITRPDVRTALGFGVEDCSPEIVYSARTTRNHTKSIGGEGINGIHVTTQ